MRTWSSTCVCRTTGEMSIESSVYIDVFVFEEVSQEQNKHKRMRFESFCYSREAIFDLLEHFAFWQCFKIPDKGMLNDNCRWCIKTENSFSFFPYDLALNELLEDLTSGEGASLSYDTKCSLLMENMLFNELSWKVGSFQVETILEIL